MSAIGPISRQRALGVLCGLAAAAIWGGGAVVSRHLVTSSLDPADLTLLRYLGCFPVALALVMTMGDRMRLTIGWPRLAVLLVLGGPLYHALVVAGYRHASAAGGALLLSGLLPVFALGLNYTVSAATAPSRVTLFGVIAVVAGLGLFGSGPTAALSEFGIVIFAAAAACWALLNECVRRWQVDPIRLTIVLALYAPAFLPLYLLAGSEPGMAAPPGELLLQLAYHGWLVAIGATALFFASVRLAGAQISAALQALSPGFSAVLGAAILSEPLMPAQFAGLVLVTAGVLLTLSAPSPAVPSDARLVHERSRGRAFLVGPAPRLKLSRWS